MSSQFEIEDAEFKEYLAHNLAAETERFREDLHKDHSKKLNQWSVRFWLKVRTIIKSRNVPSLIFDQFMKLEFMCLKAHKECLTRISSMSHFEEGDSRLLNLIEKNDEKFRKNITHLQLNAQNEITKKRNTLRSEVILLWRLKKREMLDAIYTKTDAKSQELQEDIEFLTYADFVNVDKGILSRYFC